MNINEYFKNFKEYLKSIKESESNIKNHPSNAKKAFEATIGTPSLTDLVNETDKNKQLEYCDDVLNALRLNNVDPGYKTYSGCIQAINRLKEYIASSSVSICLKPIYKKITTSKSKFTPCLNIPFGEDSERHNVFYEDVPINKQVPNLCAYIEELYGNILRRFRELFKEYIDVHEEFDTIPVILSDECPSYTWEKSDKYIAKEIAKLSEKHSPLDYNEVYKIIKNRTVCDRVLGKFIHPNPHIKIYYMNFNTSNVDEFFAMICNTLAHEIMHYFEYKYCIKNKVNPFSIDDLSESLAEMFALIISIYRQFPEDVQVAKKRYESWIRLYDSGWPYADALNFLIVKGKAMTFTDIYLDYVYHGSIDKLQEVFGKCIDPNEAYKILLTY